MNNLHFNINLSLNPLTIPVEELPTDVWWKLLPITLVGTDLLYFLFTKKIKISKVSTFYEENNSEIYKPASIHSDCVNIGDITKLIWMYGDSDHTMSWYLPKPNTILDYAYDTNNQLGTSIRNYTKYTREQLYKIYSTKIGFPSLIQVGIPHQVTTFKGKRRSLTIILQDFNNNYITMNDAKIIFKDIIL